MNPHLSQLQPYPFEKIRKLLEHVAPPPGSTSISFAMGEPKHPAPSFVLDVLNRNLAKLALYPTTKGSDALRESICRWLSQRFGLAPALLNPGRHVLPVNGTREALFSFAQAVVNRASDALVVSPNPFYQIYEGATLLAGATPHYLNTTEENGFVADFAAVPAQVWQRCQLVYLCSPATPRAR